MILFMNVLITDKRLSPHFKWERGLLPPDNRLDIFKYSLASFRAINNWSKVVLYIDLDESYKGRWYELQNFIFAEFKEIPTNIFKYRLTKQSEWQRALKQDILDDADDLVWFFCNDDHIFIDTNVNMLNEMIARLKISPHEYNGAYMSHWPELSKRAIDQSWIKYQNHWEGAMATNDSIQLVNKNWLRNIWFEHDYNEALMPRTDYTTQAMAPTTYYCIPGTEQCRHYDGYTHVGISINEWPPLRIPPGFFDNDIKIRYNWDRNVDGWVNIAPYKKNFTTIDPNGTDYRFKYNEYPLCWKNRISKVEANV
jgi:hypothetical protein